MEERKRLLQEIAKYEKLVSMIHPTVTSEYSQSSDRANRSVVAAMAQSTPSTKSQYKWVNKCASASYDRKVNSQVAAIDIVTTANKTGGQTHCQPIHDKNQRDASCNNQQSVCINNSLATNKKYQNPYKWSRASTSGECKKSKDDLAILSSIKNSPGKNTSSLTRIKTVPSSLSAFSKEYGKQTVMANSVAQEIDKFCFKSYLKPSNVTSHKTQQTEDTKKLTAVSHKKTLRIDNQEAPNLEYSHTNINKNYNQSMSSVQKSFAQPAKHKISNSYHTSHNLAPSNPKVANNQIKITIHKSNTKVLNKYVSKVKKPVLKTSTKIINQYVTSPSVRPYQKSYDKNNGKTYFKNNVPFNSYMTRTNYRYSPAKKSPHNSEIINIDGHLYKRITSSSRKVQKTVQKTKIGERGAKVIHIRGSPFTLSHNGQKLERMAIQRNDKTPTNTPNRFRLGNSVYVRKSQAEYVKDVKLSVQKLAVKKITKSIDVMHKRDIKGSAKKQYCLYYNRFGRCSKGEKCQFIHDPQKIAVCTRFLRGSCKVNKCQFSHEVSENKMPVCRFFIESYCNKEKCPYLHVNVGRQAEICSDFQMGFCPNGKNCNKMHIFVCKEYRRTGVCTRGKNCKYTHIHPKKYRKDKRELCKETSYEAGKSIGATTQQGSHGNTEENKSSRPTCEETLRKAFPSFLELPSDDESGEDEDKSGQLQVFGNTGDENKDL